MIKKYDEFLLENIQKAKSIYKQKLEDFESLRNKLEKANRSGWMGKFAELLFNGIPKKELEDLFTSLEDLKKKNININIDSFDSYEKLLDEIIKIENQYKLKSVLNKFPKKQKDLVNYSISPTSPKQFKGKLLARLTKLSNMDNKSLFINKVSSFNDIQSLYNALVIFTDSSGMVYTREYVKSILDAYLKLVYEDSRFIIVEAKTHAAIVKIGKDTSWCIVRSAQQFKSYTRDNRKQFVIIDYSKGFFENDYKIGFTTDSNSILYAHDISDKSVIPYTQKLLNDSNISIKKLGGYANTTLESLEKMSAEKIVNTLAEKVLDISMDDIYKLFNLLEEKKVSAYDKKNLIKNIIKSILNNKEITEKEFDKYKTKVKNKELFDEIKNKLITDELVIESSPSDPFKYNLDLHYKYYKSWDFSFKDSSRWTFLNYIDKLIMLEEDKKLNDVLKYSEIFLHYLSTEENLTIEQAILKILCLGNINEITKKEVDLGYSDNYISQLLDALEEKYQPIATNSARWSILKASYIIKNKLGIKYHYDDKKVDRLYSSNLQQIKFKLTDILKTENIIKEPIIIKSLNNLTEKLNFLKDFDCSIVCSAISIIGLFRDQLLRSRKIPTLYKNVNYTEEFKLIFEIFSPYLTRKSGYLYFKDEVKLPFKFKVKFKWLEEPREIEITIKDGN